MENIQLIQLAKSWRAQANAMERQANEESTTQFQRLQLLSQANGMMDCGIELLKAIEKELAI